MPIVHAALPARAPRANRCASCPPARSSPQDSAAASDTFFADLGTYLTLERAQRLYGFEAGRYGLDDAAAAEIAAVFARVRAGGWHGCFGCLLPAEGRHWRGSWAAPVWRVRGRMPLRRLH